MLARRAPPQNVPVRPWVKRFLAISAAAALLLGGAGLGAYVWLTRPEALRARVLAALRGAGLTDARIGAARFSLRTGLKIESIVLARPGDSDATRLADIPEATLQGAWQSILSGDLSGSTLHVRGAQVNLLGASALSDADLLDSPLPAWSRWRFSFPAEASRKLPRIVFEDAAIHLRGREAGRLQLLERWIVSGVGAPTPEGYNIALRRQREADAELCRIQILTDARKIVADFGWMRIETLTDFLPEGLRALLSNLTPGGTMRVARADLNFPADDRPLALTEALSAIHLELRGGALSFPLEDGWPREMEEQITPMVDRYVQVSALQGAVRWSSPSTGNECSLALQGRFRDGQLDINASTTADRLTEAFRRWRGGRKAALALDDLDTMEIKVRDLDLPTHAQRSALLESNSFGKTLGDVARKYEPEGRIHLTMRLPPREARPPPEQRAAGYSLWEGQLDVLSGHCRYVNFPYPFDHVTGQLRFAGGRTEFVELIGRHGAVNVRLTGEIESTAPWSGFRLQARGFDVPLNADLYRSIPPRFQQLWARAAPLGLADMDVHLSRPTGTPETGPRPVQVSVQARLAGGSLDSGKERLDGVSATVAVGSGEVDLQELFGHMGSSLVRAAGRLPAPARVTTLGAARIDSAAQTPRAGAPSMDETVAAAPLRVTAFDVPVTYETQAFEPPNAPLTFVGSVDLRTMWSQMPGGESGAGIREIVLKAGRVQGPARGLVWQVQGGRITERPEKIVLHRAIAKAGRARLTASGSFGRPVSAADPLDLTLQLQSPDLSQALSDLLPLEQRDWMNQLGLAGAGGVIVHLLDDGAAKGASPQGGLPPRVELELESAWLRPEIFPLPLRGLRACLRLNGPFYELTQCEALLGPTAPVQLSGTGVISADGISLAGALTARDVRVDEKFVEAAPEALRGVLKALGVRGRFNLALEKLRTDGQGAWSFAGRVEGSDATLTTGLTLTQSKLTVLSEGSFGAAGDVELRGTFRLESGKLAGLPVDHWSGRFRVARDAPMVYLDELRGQWCGGQILGSARYDWRRQRYEVSLEVAGANLSQLVALQANQRSPVKAPPGGTVSGRFELSGYAEDVASRVGSGALILRGVPFRGTPVLEPVVRSAPRTDAPVKGTPADVEMDIELKGNRVRVARVDLSSEDLRLLGAGSYTLSTGHLDLRLFGAHPRHMPRIAGVTELLDSAKRGLVQFRITGTLDAPKVDVTPLPLLNDALRLLLGQE